VVLTYYKLSVRATEQIFTFKSIDFNWEEKEKRAIVRFHSFSFIDWYKCAWIYILYMATITVASHRCVDGSIIVVVVVGEDQYDTWMRWLTLSKREKSKGDFLASCSLFSFSIVLLSLTAVAECASERKRLHECNASRCLCFSFVCARARVFLCIRLELPLLSTRFSASWVWSMNLIRWGSYCLFSLCLFLYLSCSCWCQLIVDMMVDMNRHKQNHISILVDVNLLIYTRDNQDFSFL
jgi:hypothetical protein